MNKAAFPQRTCREPVAGSYQNYSCELPDLHPGPCASFSVVSSVERRDAWEAAHEGWEERIGVMDILVDTPGAPPVAEI